MPIEIEAKMRLDDRAALVQTLQRLGAAFVAELAETNSYFDVEDGALKRSDQALRLRIEVTGPGTPEERTVNILAHKGPRSPGKLKSREETEVHVDDPAAIVKLLNALGYRSVLTFEKRRTRYRLEGCLIELDELPRLGHFVEIEGPSESQVFAVREQLGLADSPLIETSYIGLLKAYLRETGGDDTAVCFAPAERM
ncbi:MAG: class IV adenylate cyclase [Phycisphaerales bacterium JB063]